MRAAVDAAGLSAVTVDEWPCWDDSGLELMMDLARAHGAGGIVVDTYRIEGAGLERLRRCPLFVVAVDDLAVEPSPCHVVVNGGASADTLPYRSVHGDTRFLLGPRYAPLRPAFWKRPARDVRERVEALLVSTGGTDPGGLGVSLVRALDALPFDFRLDVVVGPFSEGGALDAAARGGRREVRLHLHPSASAMRDLVLEAGVAVSAGGQTLYELAWAGCPAVAFELAPNQALNVRELARAGVIVSAGTVGAPDFFARVTAAVTTLLRRPELRRELGDAGQALVDGRGALRVAESLLNE